LMWFRKAAEQGQSDAQVMLGNMYFAGQGIPQDYVQALMWVRKAAEQGQSDAQVMLGSMYENGRGVPQDYVQAATWFRKAAEQGKAIAYLSLGLMYAAGRGVPQDFIQAHVWLNLAAARLPSGEHQERAAKTRETIAARMSPAQIAEAQRRAREWQPKQPELRPINRKLRTGSP
jgi:uncharacterized protein